MGVGDVIVAYVNCGKSYNFFLKIFSSYPSRQQNNVLRGYLLIFEVVWLGSANKSALKFQKFQKVIHLFFLSFSHLKDCNANTTSYFYFQKIFFYTLIENIHGQGSNKKTLTRKMFRGGRTLSRTADIGANLGEAFLWVLSLLAHEQNRKEIVLDVYFNLSLFSFFRGRNQNPGLQQIRRVVRVMQGQWDCWLGAFKLCDTSQRVREALLVSRSNFKKRCRISLVFWHQWLILSQGKRVFARSAIHLTTI